MLSSSFKVRLLLNVVTVRFRYLLLRLLEALDHIIEPKRPSDKPLRLPLRDVYNIGGIGTVAAGRVETGVIRPGMPVTFGPHGVTTRVRSLEMDRESVSEGHPGERVGFKVAITNKELKRGCVASHTQVDPAKSTYDFTSQLYISSHPGKISKGFTPLVHCHTSSTAVRFAELCSKVDKRSGKEVEREPEYLKQGDSAIVKMVPSRPMVAEDFSKYPPLGRFVFRDNRRTVGFGVIRSVTKRNIAKEETELAISNLCYSATEKKVLEFFQSKDIKINSLVLAKKAEKFQGHGIIKFASSEDHKKALELNGSLLAERELVLELYVRDKWVPLHVIVNGFRRDSTKPELLTFFESKSRPVESYLPMLTCHQNKGFLFLYFQNYRDYRTALDFEGATFQNRTIHVHPGLSGKRGGGYGPWSREYAKHNAQEDS